MIRAATTFDIPRLLDLARAMHAESRFADRYPLAEDKLATMLEGAILSRVWCALVVERDGEVIGGFVGYVSEQWFSRAKVAQDVALFIEPSRRGGMEAVRLIQSFAAWGRDQGAIDIEIGVNTGVQMERTGRLLAAAGFNLVGQLYTKGVV